MKTIILMVALLATQISNAQNVQTFAKEQFSISSPCKLTRNEEFIKMVKERGGNNILNAFVCAENQSNFCLSPLNSWTKFKKQFCNQLNLGNEQNQKKIHT